MKVCVLGGLEQDDIDEDDEQEERTEHEQVAGGFLNRIKGVNMELFPRSYFKG